MSNIKAITRPITLDVVIELAEERLKRDPNDQEMQELTQRLKDMRAKK